MTRFFPTPADFRAWLEENHAMQDELWVGYWKKATGKPSMTWPESVEEALCFGWIDGLRRSIDGERYRIRFTPRRPDSTWSTTNIRNAEKLIAEARMRPPGHAAFERRRVDRERQYFFEQGEVELGEEREAELRANPDAWAFWEAQPPGYRRTITWWVVSAKREETRQRRLKKLIDRSAAGQRIIG